MAADLNATSADRQRLPVQGVDADVASATGRAAATAASASAAARWQVRLLGGFELSDGQQTHTRLPSRAVTALLARLALWPERAHAREELIEHLWPGVALGVGRNRLRQALSTLKSIVEPAAGPAMPVLQADRLAVRVVPGALACDAREFERRVRAREVAAAHALYRGELLPGFYDEWIDDERVRLASLRERLPPEPLVGPAVRPAGDLPAVPDSDSALVAVPAAASPAAPQPVMRSLPSYLTRYFGDDIALSRLRADLRQHRLVVLLGAGGAGKTRCAVELARTYAQPALDEADAAGAGIDAGALPDLIAFVALANAHSAADLCDAVAGTLRIAARGMGSQAGADASADAAAAVLADALEGREVLLVLDNFEQLEPAADALLAQWLQRSPRLRVLVTSRRALAVDGARELEPPALVPPTAELDLAGLARNAAVALFVDRARAARADFHLGAGNAAAVAALAVQLDGLPLALELAAARVRSLPPAQLLDALATPEAAAPGAPHLELLARAGLRDLARDHARDHARDSARHATMRRVIDWSWQLLAPDEQRLLAALGVFAGGFTLEAVAAVCELPPARAAAMLDGLVAQSLLRRVATRDDQARMALSEPVREFAAEQLTPDTQRGLRARLRAWARAWAEAWPATAPLPALREEMPNLIAALDSGMADGDADGSVRLLLALRRGLVEISLPRGLLMAVQRALGACGDAALRVRGHALAARLALYGADAAAARAHLAAARELLAAAGGDADGTLVEPPLELLHYEAIVGWHTEWDAQRIRPALSRALAAARRRCSAEVRGSLMSLRASIASIAHGRHARAERLYRAERALAERSGNRHALLTADYNLACTAVRDSRHADGLARSAGLVEAARRLDNRRLLAETCNMRGEALAGLRRWREAEAAYRDYVEAAWRELQPLMLAYGLWNLPRAVAHLRQPERAARLAGFAEHFWTSRWAALGADEQRDLARLRRLLGRLAPASQIAAWWRRGAAMPLAEAVALALAAPAA